MGWPDAVEPGGRGVERAVADGGRDPIDRVLLALNEPRCRYLLYYLEDEESAYIEEVAQFISRCERSPDLEDPPAEATERVERDLYHVHLPKLAANDIVEYDRRSGAMRYQDPPEALSAFLDLASSVELSGGDIEKF